MSSDLFETLFNLFPSPAIAVKANPPHFTIMASNHQHKLATNYVGIDIVGKGTWEVFTPEDEARKNEFDVLHGGLMEAIETREAVKLPVFRYDMPSGEGNSFKETWWQLEVIPLIENGQVAFLMAITHNITGQVLGNQAFQQVRQQQEVLQKEQALNEELGSLNRSLAESEKRFRLLLDTIPQIAWTNTVDGEVNFYNQQWYDYTGLNFEDTRADGWHKVIHPDDLRYNIKCFGTILSGETGGEFEVRERRNDGEYRWHLIRMLPVKEEKGRIESWIGTATDIHELKILHQQKDDFITIASHELKTPITTLKASLQLLNRSNEEADYVRLGTLINMANKSMDRINDLVEDLLNTSKFSQGQIHLNPRGFVICRLIENCFTHILHGNRYHLTIKGDTGSLVYADAERIDQVMTNLINNAIKYAPDSKEITVSITRQKAMVKTTVTDKGPGIAIDKIPHIFNRYYRVDNQGMQYSGLGLGLYICSEIIKKHGGEIGVESVPGEGSSFWFTLPAA